MSNKPAQVPSKLLINLMMLGAVLPFSVGSAYATSFTISVDSTIKQTLAASETGTVNAGKSLTVSGSNVAVTITGNNTTLTNLGTLKQIGDGRAIRDNTGVTGLVITNGSLTNSSALMQAADADVIQMNKAGGKVTFNNYGTLTSLNASKGGAQAVDFSAITSTGSNTLTNYATGIIQARDADAVRPGVNGFVYNYGQIIATNTTDPSDDGVDLQANTGAAITNYSTGSITGARHGITGGAANNAVLFTTSVNNSGTITGNNGSGINLDGFNNKQTATIVNGGTITGNGISGDGDGIDVDGVVTITNTGTIRSVNSFSSGVTAQSEGITVGGGSIINSGTIEGLVASGNSNAVGRGITLAGVDTSGTPEPIYANSTITNQAGGLIKGQSDSAIVVAGAASGYTVTVNNYANATLLGGGATYAALRTGADNDTINNAGIINGSSSGKAIDLGGGNDTLNITGGSASILGSINGGTGINTLLLDLGAGNSFVHASAISNFGQVEVRSGELILNGSNLISSGGLLALSGGDLEMLNAVGANGQTFAGLNLTGNAMIDLNNATSLTFNSLGTVGDGLSLAITDYLTSSSPSYAFRFQGNYSANADFLKLIGETQINGMAASYSYDGSYTNVTLAAAPIPEADTYAFMALGMGLVGLLARRRKV